MKWGTSISVLAMVGAIVLVGIQRNEINQLQQRIAELEAQANPASGDLAKSSSRQIDNVRSRTGPAKSKAGDRVERTPGSSDPLEEDADLGQSLRKMVDNPAGQALMNQGVKAMTMMWYRDLIEEYDLNRKESDYFVRLVSEPMSAQQRIGMKMMDAKSPEEREALVEEIEAANEETKNAIKDFLNNDEDFATYEKFAERLPERQQLDGIRAAMDNADASLTTQQEELVVEAMYQARLSGDHTASPDINATGAVLGKNAVEEFERNWEKSSQRTAEEVGKVLEEAQLEAFRNYQNQMKDMQVMSLKMAAKMFNTGEENPDE